MLKRHFSYKVCLTFFFVVFLFSCRKEQASVSVPQEIVAERFFNEHRTNSTEEKHLVDYLSRLNEKKGFINKTVERIGFPHWDKLVKYSFLSSSSGNVASLSTGSSSKQDSATNYIIPFVRDTQNYVNAAMFIKTDKGDTSISYLCDWQYSKFRTPAQISQANDIAIFFMLFDRKVYGHQKFDVLDSALFRKNNKKAITISFKNTDSSNTNGFSTYTCTSYTITYYHCPAPVGSCNGYQGECDGCFDYCRTDDSFTICNWVASVSPPGNDFGGGGTPPPDNGSGSNIGGSGNNDVAVPPSNNDGLRPGWRWAGKGGSNNINQVIRQIKYKVPLSFSDEQYLTINQTIANELLEIIESDSENEALVISTRLALSVLKNNSFNSEDILREYNLYHNQNYLESDPISDAILRYFVLKYATLKAENSNLPADQRKSDLKLLYLTFSDAIHTGLDLLGLIPIGGEVFDIISGLTYHLEGDKTNAYLSYASAIPWLGYAAAGVKAIKAGSVIIAVVGKKGFLVASRVSQSAFRKACGAVGNQVGHHIIPFHEIVQSHPLMQMAFRAGFDPNNAAINGKAIEAVRNSGNHYSYANKIKSKFDDEFSIPPPGGWDPKSSKLRLEKVITEIKKAIDAQPGVHVDDLIF
jgi:hypothetical protein